MGEKPDVGIAGVIFSLLCCWPLGIPALVFQLKIDNQWGQGDFQGAQESADKAKKFRNIAFILGSISYGLSLIIWIISVFVLGAAATSANEDIQELEQMQESYGDYNTEDLDQMNEDLDQLNEDLEQDLQDLETSGEY
ncbi:CD225/dispanin family protein [Nocardiopsis sp. CNT-189]|uniref:CD225/dispanin family protein n=1 Tax=Nocardiopsis oceanisediminis TaxID=2816862 RepID=UPI003B3B943A